jgi:hypothetical protein
MRRWRILLVGLLAAISMIAFPSPAEASSYTPAVTCKPSTLGWLWEDPDGITWICKKVWLGDHWHYYWVPDHVFIPTQQLSNPYSGTYGNVLLVSGLDNNPDIGFAMTHSRNPDGSTRTQGVGELRTKVVIQKWTGSAWTTCQNTGYSYSSGQYSEWGRGFNMYTYADCGSATYRTVGYGYMYDAAWRGGTAITSSCFRD